LGRQCLGRTGVTQEADIVINVESTLDGNVKNAAVLIQIRT
jgi:hypothetical protein